MTPRERFVRVLNRQGDRHNPFWIGHPADATKEIYYRELGIESHHASELEQHNADSSVLLAKAAGKEEVDFNLALGSDMIWISPELDMRCWKHPEGKPMWDCFDTRRTSLGQRGIFADCEDAREVEAFDWPNPDHMDISPSLEDAKYAYDSGLAVFGGMWCPLFHTVSDFFGMEEYFIKMKTDPDVVHAVTEHVMDFYLRANERVLAAMKPFICAGFFGSDIGCQRDLMISLDCYREFIHPYIARIAAQIHSFGLKVAFHSCGAIDRIIPDLIDAGIEVLHPLQAKAAGMNAEHLAKEYGGDLVFMGGVDTQELLPFGRPDEVRRTVLHLREVFGENYIVSPSHEALLPNVPFENVRAMIEAARE